MAINTKTYTDNKLLYQDDFRHSAITLYNYKGDPIDITDNVISIDVFESIKNHTLTGTITFGDVNSVVERLPIIGKEFVEFKLRTPVQYNGQYGGEINAVKHKFFVYKISILEQTTPRNQLVQLSFASVEMLRNSRIRVSEAFSGSYEDAVQKIFKSKKLLNSNKALFLERTRLSQKVVVPNLRPFDTIDMFANRSVSSMSNSASFHFYETTQGFHFRSFDSMFRNLKTGFGPVSPTFNYMLETSGTPNPHNNNAAFLDLQRVYSHTFENKQDTIRDSRTGMMSSKLITYNAYDKTFTTKEFNYAKDYHTLPHLEVDLGGEFPAVYSIIPETPADFTEQNTNKEGRNNIYSDYTDGKTMLASNTSFIHNTNSESGYHAENTLQSRKHALEILEKIKLSMTVPGNTHINAGQVVHVTVPSYALEVYEKGDMKQYNRFLTGRYLITDLRHNIDFTKQRHTTALTLSKETYGTPLVNSLDQPSIDNEDELVVVDIGVNKEYA